MITVDLGRNDLGLCETSDNTLYSSSSQSFWAQHRIKFSVVTEAQVGTSSLIVPSLSNFVQQTFISGLNMW